MNYMNYMTDLSGVAAVNVNVLVSVNGKNSYSYWQWTNIYRMH